MEDAIHTSFYYEATQAYIEKKSGLTAAKMKDIQTANLKAYLKQHPLERANTVKLMHQWIPTYDNIHKQGRHHAPTFSRCGLCNETAIRHQNIIGWYKLMHGYISKRWSAIGTAQTKQTNKRLWYDRLTDAAILSTKQYGTSETSLFMLLPSLNRNVELEKPYNSIKEKYIERTKN